MAWKKKPKAKLKKATARPRKSSATLPTTSPNTEHEIPVLTSHPMNTQCKSTYAVKKPEARANAVPLLHADGLPMQTAILNADSILQSRDASDWLKGVLSTALERNSVEAVRDAALLDLLLRRISNAWALLVDGQQA